MSVSYEHIACCIDDSEAAARSLAHGAALRELTGGRLTVVHVHAPPPVLVSMAATLGGAPVHDDATEHEAARMWLAEQVRTVDAEGVLLEGDPAPTACAWAKDAGCDLLVAASHRGLVERVLLGSFASYVAHHAPCAVLLIPPPAEGER
jgi:nucleotide-binding universal stress UspA family protein